VDHSEERDDAELRKSVELTRRSLKNKDFHYSDAQSNQMQLSENGGGFGSIS
jgi:hypothetical protein